MSAIADRLQSVRSRIDAAARAAGRDPATVGLLAVSKTWPAAAVQAAVEAGQTAFGESYVQEAVEKIAEVRRLLATGGPGDDAASPAGDPGPDLSPTSLASLSIPPSLAWHFIGPLQSNKTRPVAENFAWVHSIERLKIAERLSAQRPGHLPPLQVCVQVNVSGEASKSGCDPAEAGALCRQVAALPGLRLRGLMAIPAPVDDPEAQRRPFRQLRQLFESLRAGGLVLDTLSMGMSHDLEAAVAEGATLVRIGTAIFGERTYP